MSTKLHKSCTGRRRPFVFLHVGDLHITEMPPTPRHAPRARNRRLLADLNAIFADIDSIRPKGGFDFVYLPGDLAENACRSEYDTLSSVLNNYADIRVRLIPGDHDRARGSMHEFARFRDSLSGKQRQKPPREHQCVEQPLDLTPCPPPDSLHYNHIEQYYFHKTYRGVRCLFLDLVSAGYGQKGIGLDFRLGRQQWGWLVSQIEKAKKHEQNCAVFMHCYPDDIHDHGDAADISGLFWNSGVRLVEMGHTHYNEIAHDGRTLYATARSVGQNEDGPVGYAVVAMDGNVTSWRFKQLQQTWPFVMITSPADRRVATEPLTVCDGKIKVRALILSDQSPDWSDDRPSAGDVDPCERRSDDDDACQREQRYRAWCSVDHGEWLRMDYIGESMFELDVAWPPGSQTVSVNVQDGRWASRMQDFIDVDSIEPALEHGAFKYKSKPEKPGSGAFAVRAWPAKGIRGDKLGPNGGGRKW